MTKRLDIFRVLKHINDGDTKFLNALSEEEFKGFQPFVVMLWLKNPDVNVEFHTVLTNEVLNPYIFDLGRHPRLLYKLMCVSNGFGDNARYTFKKKANNSTPATIDLLQSKYGFNKNKALEALQIMTLDDIVAVAEEMGYDDAQLKKVKQELTKKEK